MSKYKVLTEQRNKVQTNHQFTHMYFKEAYLKLKEFRSSILSEKVEWENERSKFHDLL